MSVSIRLMKEGDILGLSEIYVDVYTHFDVGEKWTVETAKELLTHWLKIRPDLAFVAEADGKLAGAFVVDVKPWWDGNHLFGGELFVHPDHQKSGIGTKLCIKMYETALEKYNVTVFETLTFKKTEFPLKWYKSHGFREDEDCVLISGNVRTLLSKLKEKS